MELSLKPEQAEFVAPNSETLAEAYVATLNGDAQFRPFAIYSDDAMVGFIIYGKWREDDDYHLWALMIGAEHQGRGDSGEAH